MVLHIPTGFFGLLMRRPDSRRIRVCRLASLILMVFLLHLGCSKEPERLTIVFSNDTMGKIRSCGCPKNDLGGLGRQATFVRTARDTAQHLLLLDGGDFFGTQINYGKEKADVSMKSMIRMEYDGIAPGEAEFSMGFEYFRDRAREIDLPVILSNVYDGQTGELLFPAHKIVTYPSGLRVGLIGVFGDKIPLPPQVEAGSIEIKSPISRVRSELKAIRAEVDLVAILAHMGFNEARDLAIKLDGIDIIILGHEGRPMRSTRQFNGAYLLQVPKEGRFLGVAHAVLNAERKIADLTVQQQPMSKAFIDDEAIVKLFKAYDIDIALKEKSTAPTGVTNPGQTVRKPFVADGKCRECHAEIADSWAASRHAAAFDILVEQSRDYDRDCTPCHTTGFYDVGGFVNAKSTPDLVHVQCESCHGNGFDHSSDPGRKTGKNAGATCAVCHTEQWTPSFDFSSKWQIIAH
jgi:2',3'-cyclic-nucleotide 2'-phosphodiesterase (5'-nucleotidase family)